MLSDGDAGVQGRVALQLFVSCLQNPPRFLVMLSGVLELRVLLLELFDGGILGLKLYLSDLQQPWKPV